MIGIVIVAHGGLAREYRAAVEHVVGKQDRLLAISTGPDDDRAEKQQEIAALSSTRTARAFMLLGRVAGTFD